MEVIMKAAVVTEFGLPPHLSEVDEPVATRPDEEIVEVVAAALSPRVRSQAAGSHYTSTGSLPLIPGIDGVGRRADGSLVYFLLPDTDKGSMGERVTIDRRRAVSLPDGADPVLVAAAMNPAMASWVALRRRVDFADGGRVVVLGATGSAGRAAVQAARRLGASRIAVVGRGIERLEALRSLGASDVVDLAAAADVVERQLAEVGAEADVVLDFLWGEPTRTALYAIVPNRARDEQLLTWVQIGSVAGAECAIPSAALRAVNLRIIGSGQGSVAPRDYRDEIAHLADEIAGGTFATPMRTVALADVERTWLMPDSGARIVFVP